MYKLKLVYDSKPRTQTLKETLTHCACVELYTHLRIESYQTSATVLEFERESDRIWATLYLSSNQHFTTVVLD